MGEPPGYTPARIEPPIGVPIPLEQRLRAHMARLEDDVFTTVILTPVARKNSPLGLESMKQPRSGKRRQDVERRVLHPGRLEKIECLAKNRIRITIEPEHDSRLYGNTVRMDAVDYACIFFYAIEPFVDSIHTRLGDGFQTNE